ncbi:MAG: helix-turn-helix transcriptional regulator [Defluviitaleaceae bacterium]|nr:helix-turn-helix transcriptional regulator [Defluviitaleaceae bacterium]
MIEPDTKENLLNAFFNMKGNSRPDLLPRIEEELKEYRQKNGYDRQIEDVLLLCTAFKLELEFNDFEEACKTLLPIIEREANNPNELDLTDIRIITLTLAHVPTYVQSILIGKKLLKNLQKYTSYKGYFRLKMAIHANTAYRIIRAKYFDDVENSYEELKNEFLTHIDTALAICNREDFFDAAKGVNLARKGIFLEDMELINKGLNLTKEKGNEHQYKMLVTDVDKYKSYIKFPTTEAKLKYIIGKNIKYHREARNISLSDLARAIGVSYSFLFRIEKGDKVVSIYHLSKFSEILGVTTDALIYGVDESIPYSYKNTQEINEFNAMAMNLNSVELGFVMATIKELVRMRKKIIKFERREKE